jgi:hypothetical protein
VLLRLIHELIPLVRASIPLGQLVVVVLEELGGVVCEPLLLCLHATFGVRDGDFVGMVVKGAGPDVEGLSLLVCKVDADTRLTAETCDREGGKGQGVPAHETSQTEGAMRRQEINGTLKTEHLPLKHEDRLNIRIPADRDISFTWSTICFKQTWGLILSQYFPPGQYFLSLQGVLSQVPLYGEMPPPLQ